MIVSGLLLVVGFLVIAVGQIVEARANPGRLYPMGFRRGAPRLVMPPAVPWVFAAGSVTVWLASIRFWSNGFSWPLTAVVLMGFFLAYLGPVFRHNRRLRAERARA